MADYSLGEALLGTGVSLDGLRRGFDQAHGESQSWLGGMGTSLQFALGGLLADLGRTVISGVKNAITSFATEAIEAEVVGAQLDAVLKSTGRAAQTQSDQWAAAQGKFVTTTGLSADKLQELNDKLNDTQFELRAATARLHDQEAAWSKSKTHTESGAIAMESTRRKIGELHATIANLNGEIAQGGPKQVAMAKALGLTQPVAQITKEALLGLADSLQKVTRFSDETIISGESLLLTFTNIGADIFPQATETMLNMSTALGQDLKGSAIQLGKALQDPILGVTALRRVGVNFNDAQMETIKRLVKSGDLLKAQKMILAELQTEFGGSARAAGQTFAGQLDILNNKIGNVKEEIGNALLPTLQDITKGFIKLADSPQVEKWTDRIKAGIPEVISKIGGLGEKVGTFPALIQSGFTPLQATATILKSVFGPKSWDIINTTRDRLQSFIDILSPSFSKVSEAGGTLLRTLTDSWPQIQATLSMMGDTVSRVFGQVAPAATQNLTGITDSVAGILNRLAEIWRNHGAEIMAIVKIAFDLVATTIGGALMLASAVVQNAVNTIKGILDALSAALKGNWEGAWNALLGTFATNNLNMANALNGFFNLALGLVGTNMTEFRATWEEVWSMLPIVLGKVWQDAKDTVAKKLNEMTSGIQTGIINTINGVREKVADFKELGTSLITGLIKGAEDMAAKLTQAVKDVVNGAINAAKGLLGIKSPSQVFADIGAGMMAGMATGILRSTSLPVLALSGATQQLVTSQVYTTNDNRMSVTISDRHAMAMFLSWLESQHTDQVSAAWA